MIALATAACVFVVGVLVLPPIEPPEPPPVLVPPPAPPPPAPVIVDTGVPDALPDATIDAPPDTGSAPKTAPKPDAKAENKPAPSLEPKPSPAPPVAAPIEAAGPRDKSPDKEVARDAWRKNLPDVAADGGKAALLIPIKGSIEGATYHVTVKPRSVLVTLPKAESMITMPFYNVRHDGFRQLWIKKDDQTGVTNLRIVLGEASDPQVEIKDDFVRVTVRRLTETPNATTPATGAAPGAATPANEAPPAPVPSKPAGDGG